MMHCSAIVATYATRSSTMRKIFYATSPIGRIELLLVGQVVGMVEG
jgi:hypothetical protein